MPGRYKREAHCGDLPWKCSGYINLPLDLPPPRFFFHFSHIRAKRFSSHHDSVSSHHPQGWGGGLPEVPNAGSLSTDSSFNEEELKKVSSKLHLACGIQEHQTRIFHSFYWALHPSIPGWRLFHQSCINTTKTFWLLFIWKADDI